MTGKERIRATIARRGTDCVPLGFYAVDHEIVSKVLGRATYVMENSNGIWNRALPKPGRY